jgi:hypothetical protein
MPRAGRTPLPFKLTDVSRAIKAVTGAGAEVDRISIDPKTGRIDVIVKNDAPKGGDRAA